MLALKVDWPKKKTKTNKTKTKGNYKYSPFNQQIIAHFLFITFILCFHEEEKHYWPDLLATPTQVKWCASYFNSGDVW